MNSFFRKIDKYSIYRALIIAGCIILNVGLYFTANRFNLPLYLDTVGTITIAMLCGTFPGVFTAVATNFICEIFAPDSVYYSFIGIVIALITSWFFKNEKHKVRKNIIFLVGALALAGGVLGTVFQWLLLGNVQFGYIAEAARSVSGSGKVLYFLVSMGFILVINIVDKGIALGAAAGIVHLIPKETRFKIRTSGWKQSPLSLKDMKAINASARKGGRSLKYRIGTMLALASVAIVLVFTWVSTRLAYNSIVGNGKKDALSAANLAGSFINTDALGEYAKSGESPAVYEQKDPEYKATNDYLCTLLENVPDIEAIYVYYVKDGEMYIVFDIEPYFQDAGRIGEKLSDQGLYAEVLPEIQNGAELEPLEVRTSYGFYVTALRSLFDSNGRFVGFVGADVSTAGFSGYIRKLIMNLTMIFAGFFALILAYGLKTARTYLLLPIGSLEASIDGFMKNIEDQDKLEENVKNLQKLDIRTNDEVEGLYNSVCEMAVGTAEQMRSIRLLAKKNEKMQSGLIITMADMVENRDSDTGAHVLKTAAYVRIILEGLRRKGYYSEKITDKYIKDVEMSAPLHDVGKINVSDTILNKPGKLTDEEFEIMKTHTTAGKKILENAIGTVQGENYLKEARNMAAYHHERWDGKGYPEGLHGQIIPLSARVMAVADVFDALVSPRVYKPAFPLEKAVSILREGAGTQFDPKCVEVFLDSLADIKKVLKKYQDQQN
ncbi:MAG: HD domain-containing protein [Lachnospiraceae bacterium]|nr:HD domain-containing protein [Lachnospiraceae bacterium]